MKRKKRGAVVSVSLVLLLLYILLFPSEVSRETVFTPEWSLFVDEAPTPGAGDDAGNLYGYRMGDVFGFFGMDGRIVSRESVVFEVTLGRSGYINFSRVPRNLVYKSPDGRIVESFPFIGYPNLDPHGDRIFFLSSDSTAVSALEPESGDAWRIEFSTMVTSLAGNGDRTAVGLLDGRILVYGPSGDLLHSRRVEGSRIPVVLGCDVESGGRAVAGIAGIDPQRVFLLQERRDGEWTFAARELRSDLRREAFVRFDEAGRFVFFEVEDGIGVLETASLDLELLPLDGSLQGMGQSQADGLVCLLDRTEERNRLTVYSVDGRLYAREPVPCGSEFLRQVGRRIVLGCGGRRLLRVDIGEM